MNFSDNFLKEIENTVLKEEWKPIIIDENKTNYIISSYGKVQNLNTGELLKARKRGSKNKKYDAVTLSINKLPKCYSVHRLVATAFIPNPENKPQVNHKDGNKQNNCVWNLEWATNSENIRHAYRTGLMKPSKGINSNNHIYDEEDVHNVCKMIEKGYTSKEICNKLNVTWGFVLGIRYQKNWEDIRSQYNLPETARHREYSKESVNIIDSMISNGERNRKKLIELAGLPYDKTSISYIKYRIKIHNKNAIKSSTTIPEGSTLQA